MSPGKGQCERCQREFLNGVCFPETCLCNGKIEVWVDRLLPLPACPSMYDSVKMALLQRGWKIDPTVEENAQGELKEFIHPVTGEHYAWIDATLEQYIELDQD